MQERAFEKLRAIVMRETGIALSQDKRGLLANRLSKRLRALNLSSEADYLRILETEAEPNELLEFIDAISTNVTHFFREKDHFELLSEVLAELPADEEVRIWCSACSTGEEAYTLAMTLRETLPDPARRCRILATDICMRVLRQAAEGVYGPRQLEKVPRHLISRYFSRVGGKDDGRYRVNQELRDLIVFKRMNLSHFPYPLRGPINVIFCRNVMIYFGVDLRARITRAFEELLAKGGYLFIGHSENLLGIQHGLKAVKPSVFRK